MKQAIYNASAIQNDTWGGASFETTVNGVAINLVGAAITWTIKNPDTGAVVLTKTESSGITVNTVNKFTIDPFIVTIAAGKYDHDIQVVFASGVVKTYVKGKFCVEDDV